jgi:hypothetical protein
MFSHKFNDYSAGAWLLALAAATAAVACGELAQAHMKWIGTTGVTPPWASRSRPEWRSPWRYSGIQGQA